MKIFNPDDLKKLFKKDVNSSKGDNGQVTIIGGSKLFHGAPLLALTTASRIVDMVFFASPDPTVGEVASQIKSELLSFIWIPWEETENYIEKSDAVLIGPGFMRYGKGDEGNVTREITKKFLTKFPKKKWVVDAGSLQTLDLTLIPPQAILTPNQKEYEMLFENLDPKIVAKKYNCILVIKGPSTFVYSGSDEVEVRGGNPGLTKGGTGDVQAGLTVALLANNDPFISASAASFIIKKSADDLYAKMGTFYNSDDLALSLGLYFPQIMR